MIEKNKNTLDNLKLRAKQAAALGVTAVVAVAAVEHFKGNELHAGHDKVYTTHVGDTEWGIAERAYPNQDPRAVIGLIQSQESAADQKAISCSLAKSFISLKTRSLAPKSKPLQNPLPAAK